MALKIEQDHNRFRQIVRGKIKANLKKYISHEELIGRKGKDLISIPIPQIDIPTFRFAPKSQGGVGQGDGDSGTPIAVDEGEGSGEAGNLPGEHLLEVDITLEELAQILGEELELPKIEPKGHKKIQTDKEVNEEVFYHIRESGGTMISSAYHFFDKMINEEYDLGQWNIYGFHFSDGDNWSGGDTDKCISLLQKELLQKVNLFCYGQVE